MSIMNHKPIKEYNIEVDGFLSKPISHIDLICALNNLNINLVE